MICPTVWLGHPYLGPPSYLKDSTIWIFKVTVFRYLVVFQTCITLMAWTVLRVSLKRIWRREPLCLQVFMTLFIGFSGPGEEWTVFTGCPRPLIGRTQTVQSWWSVWGAQAQDTLNLEGRRGLHFPVWPGFKFRHHHLPTVRCGEDLPVTWSSDRALFPGLLWSLDLLTDIRAVFRKYANQCGHRVVCT